MNTELGRISKVTFGHTGYQDTMLGIHFELSLKCKSRILGDYRSAWDPQLIPCSEHSKWTEEERNQTFADIMHYISQLLADAKVHNIQDLEGIPVEITLDGLKLDSWRILTEVL
jgi:hypothetical protein